MSWLTRFISGLMVVVGVAMITVYPAAMSAFFNNEIVTHRVNVESGSGSFRAELIPDGNPYQVRMVAQYLPVQSKSPLALVLPVSVDFGTETVFSDEITCAFEEVEEIGGSRRRTDFASSIFDISEPGTYEVNASSVDGSGFELLALDVSIVANAADYPPANWGVAAGLIALGGMMLFVAGGMRPKGKRVESGRKRASDIGRAAPLRGTTKKSAGKMPKWGRGD
ncbi:MAG: hypothetical protein AAGI92_01580 [Pseudomonadota bacterium]